MIRQECSSHQRNPTHSPCPTCDRIKAETKVLKKTIAGALEAGYTLGVDDGEEVTIKNSTDADAVLKACQSTDEDRLLFYREGKRVGWVYFVYGNAGYEVINDYTTNLETVVAPVQRFADTLSN